MILQHAFSMYGGWGWVLGVLGMKEISIVQEGSILV